jgi:hypothetical protein
MHKVEQNCTKQTNKQTKELTTCPKLKCNTVSVGFSACRCSLVVFSSKVGREKKKESGDSSVSGICGCGLPVRCCWPAVAGGVIYADLTWPHRLYLFIVLLCVSLYHSFPLSKHTGGGDTAPTFSDLHVYLQFMWEVGLPPSPVEFSSHCHFYKFFCS